MTACILLEHHLLASGEDGSCKHCGGRVRVNRPLLMIHHVAPVCESFRARANAARSITECVAQNFNPEPSSVTAGGGVA